LSQAWKIPLFDLDYGEEEKRAVIRVIESKWISMGPQTEAFEEEFARFLGIRYTLAVSSGTSALHLAYLSLGVSRGDEVIVPSFTFISTVTPLLWIGAIPIFADIQSLKVPNISVDTVAPLLTRKTKGVVFVHYAGFMDNIEELREFCSKKGIFLLEDASHAHGSFDKNQRKAGTLGDVGVFSLFANKNIAVGEGGILVTEKREIYEKAKLMRSHGMTKLAWQKYRGESSAYDVVELGYNYRMTEIQAALGRVQLRKLSSSNKKRIDLVRKYRELLKGNEKVIVPFESFENSANYIFPIFVKEDREKVERKMGESGIQTSIHYHPVHLMTMIKMRLGTKEGMLPVTEEAGKREITLPLFPSLEKRDVEYIVEVLLNAF